MAGMPPLGGGVSTRSRNDDGHPSRRCSHDVSLRCLWCSAGCSTPRARRQRIHLLVLWRGAADRAPSRRARVVSGLDGPRRHAPRSPRGSRRQPRSRRTRHRHPGTVPSGARRRRLLVRAIPGAGVRALLPSSVRPIPRARARAVGPGVRSRRRACRDPRIAALARTQSTQRTPMGPRRCIRLDGQPGRYCSHTPTDLGAHRSSSGGPVDLIGGFRVRTVAWPTFSTGRAPRRGDDATDRCWIRAVEDC